MTPEAAILAKRLRRTRLPGRHIAVGVVSGDTVDLVAGEWEGAPHLDRRVDAALAQSGKRRGARLPSFKQRQRVRHLTVCRSVRMDLVGGVGERPVSEHTRCAFVVEGILLGLALLIAFKAASISAEERAREHATMVAFGLPISSLIGVASAESLLSGLLGWLVAILPGHALLGWIVNGYLERTYSDLGVLISVSAASTVVIMLVGVVAAGLAPLLTVRRLRRMNIAARLRTVE